jgi:hypothetical protein
MRIRLGAHVDGDRAGDEFVRPADESRVSLVILSGRMADGGWRMADGGWRMTADG